MASNINDDDREQKFALGFLVALITLVVLFAIGVGLYKTRCTQCLFSSKVTSASAPAVSGVQVPAVSAPASASATETIPEGASIRVEDGLVKFYFATGSTEVAPGATEALAKVIEGIHSGKKAVISGFHDTTGDPARNEELAKQRAESVQKVLADMGVPLDKLVLKKPEISTGTGSNAQARRVEVSLID